MEDRRPDYYEQKRQELHRAQAVLEAAVAAKAPKWVLDVIRDWRDDVGNVGD